VRIDGARAEVVPIGEDGRPLGTVDPSGQAVPSATTLAAPAPTS
jgi:hypothetical protein